MSAPQGTGAPSRERVRPGIVRRTKADGSTVYEVGYVDSDGRERRETVRGKLRDAEARRAQLLADKSRGVTVRPTPRGLTVAVAAEAWFDSLGHLAENTRRGYRSTLDTHVLPAFGRRRLDVVTVDDVAKWAQRATTLRYRVERDEAARPGDGVKRPTVPLRAATVNLALRVLDLVYGHARRRQGWAGTSPVRDLQRGERPRDERKPRAVLTPTQLAAVVAAADDTHRPLLAFLAGTGVRISEGLGLVWGDLDLVARTVSVTAQLGPDGSRPRLKTAHSRRVLGLPGSVVAVLAAHRLATADTSAGAFVFQSATGGPMNRHNATRRGLHPACKAAGVAKVSAHALRHAHGSALLADGWDLAAVSRQLGHGSVAITASTYAHVLDDDERRRTRMASLDRLYGFAPDAPSLHAV